MLGNNTAKIGSIPLIDLEHSVVDQKTPSSIFPAILASKNGFLKIIESVTFVLEGEM